jgi:hypothetical protein
MSNFPTAIDAAPEMVMNSERAHNKDCSIAGNKLLSENRRDALRRLRTFEGGILGEKQE